MWPAMNSRQKSMFLDYTGENMTTCFGRFFTYALIMNNIRWFYCCC